MEGGIYWIYGGFWSWKTIGAVSIIIKKLQRWEIVFSNISLDKKFIPNPNNFYFFEKFDHFYDILAFSWLFAMKVSEFSKKQVELWFLPFPRWFRPKINVFFDELWVFANSKDYREVHKDYWKDLQQYILQLRKLHVLTYLIIQRPHQLLSDLRVHVSGWITFKPLLWYEFFNSWSGTYWLQELHPDTFNVICEKKYDYDVDWKLYSYEIPQEKKLFRMWFKPFYYKFYDDLFLNKVFETQFRSNFLFESWFFSNLKNWSIQNRALLHNKHIYENYFNDVVDNDQSFKLPKVNFMDNPSYFIHKLFLEIWKFMSKKYYIKNIFLTIKNKIYTKSSNV